MTMKKILIIAAVVIAGALLVSFFRKGAERPVAAREEKIPADAVKMTPQTDAYPPIVHSKEFQAAVPLPGPVNSAGAEDSPFIPLDGSALYFFFTPDVRVPPEKQLSDGVSGIWASKREGNGWGAPERVWLQRPGKLALDGCEFVQGDAMWFCSAREGYAGIHWFTSERKDGKWTDGKNADFDPGFDVGELHFSQDGNELYYGSARSGGRGKNDIWMLKKTDGTWKDPENIEAVNSAEDEIMPFLTADRTELWFTRTYQGSPAVYRSKNVDGRWQKPELIISRFAGEPTLDADGNVYFIHHYYRDGVMLEADIYVARRK